MHNSYLYTENIREDAVATKAKRPIGRPKGTRTAPETTVVNFRADAMIQAALAKIAQALLAAFPGMSPGNARAIAIRQAILTAAAKVRS